MSFPRKLANLVKSLFVDPTTGNVGVGTSSPGYKLDVVGNIRMGNSSSQPVIALNNTSSGSWKSEFSFSNSGTGKWAMGVDINATGNNNFYWYDITANAERMRIDSSGNVGIGIASPAGKLQVNRSTTGTSAIFSATDGTYDTAFQISHGASGVTLSNSNPYSGSYNNLIFANSGIGETARIDSSGSFLFPNSTGTRPGSSGQYIVVSTAFYQQSGGNYYLVTTAGGSTSDATLKTNVQQLSGALAKVCAIRGVNFEFIEEPMCTADKGTQLGVIAQEVEAQYPEIVLTDDNGIKTVRYDRLVAPLIEAVKEQQAIIEQLKADVAALKAA